jgi:5-formyltetrahydrofolate cyclo-ligase
VEGKPLKVHAEKGQIRERIWRLMEDKEIARFPRPVYGRIPNFLGAEEAARKLTALPEFQRAKVVKVNPDSPQTPVREAVLSSGKVLIMPTPRLRGGFLVLDPKIIPKQAMGEASTIRGAFKYGKPADIRKIPKIDLIVAGSTAVSPDGARIGKGGGYSEIEYGILKELHLIGEKIPIVTTVHDVQIVDEVPMEEHDFSVDIIVTPTRTIRVRERRNRPKGIIWEKVTLDMLERMPILMELRRKVDQGGDL